MNTLYQDVKDEIVPKVKSAIKNCTNDRTRIMKIAIERVFYRARRDGIIKDSTCILFFDHTKGYFEIDVCFNDGVWDTMCITYKTLPSYEEDFYRAMSIL